VEGAAGAVVVLVELVAEEVRAYLYQSFHASISNIRGNNFPY
jgi:hypothetical protein